MRRAGPDPHRPHRRPVTHRRLLANLRVPDSSAGDGQWRLIETKLGLDLEGGLRVEYRALPKDGVSPTPESMGVMKDIIERRVNTTGVSEPVVVVQGSDRVVIELPGISDVDSVRRLVGQTASSSSSRSATRPRPRARSWTSRHSRRCSAAISFESAAVGTDANSGGLTVTPVLKSDGAQFAQYTGDNIGKYFAIVLDGRVISAPVINQSIPNGQVQTSPAASVGSRRRRRTTRHRPEVRLAAVRDRGAVERADRRRSARRSSTRASLAGLIGIALVMAFMIIYYRLPGVVACFALAYYTLVVYAIFRIIPVTLTLAGIAGFVLSIGMAVDANIPIFERMKEELRVGKSLPAAVEAGFNRAWNSILDLNVSSLITATILYSFGSSTIRGFALVLIIGVLVSMFSAIVVTPILRAIVRRDWARNPRLYGLRDDESTRSRHARRGPSAPMYTSSASAGSSISSRWR